MGTEPIDRMLATACLMQRPYPPEKLAAAEERIAARVADRLVLGALTFDDTVQSARAQSALFRPQQPPDGWQPDEKLLEHAAGALRAVCRVAVGDEGALQEMSSFIGYRTPEPDGAVILGCVLQLAAREDSARFWWQFAAGAGNTTAAYCLYLHHLALGEGPAADWWYRQMVPDRHALAPDEHEVLMHRVDLGLAVREPTSTVRMTVLPEAAEAVVRYVPTVIEYVDDVELPLPTDGFAEHIEELAATH
ncbi:hypothetical protein JK364_51195 [Streptomyces sp. 110]|uniref:Uncharacterized protein n=1 Tax=Streptomyces endocoffeicus TaxID=2898945 RepID=A0ABS1Q7R9_9ACTN|nr:hypothetical protein [Streptomyces endocoffeicus]MBL1120599.1 hypothetical protein [Streptomyces endocoffeicus]